MKWCTKYGYYYLAPCFTRVKIGVWVGGRKQAPSSVQGQDGHDMWYPKPGQTHLVSNVRWIPAFTTPRPYCGCQLLTAWWRKCAMVGTDTPPLSDYTPMAFFISFHIFGTDLSMFRFFGFPDLLWWSSPNAESTKPLPAASRR